ncbi:3-oxoacyl-ACP synthase III family protein [Undibacterium luofuense]|uniref:3-oxoacyl-ACP synthase n=1 Tax=Undibacterium luofuense TaxID=2828733 RepID=A0A941I6B0_9BURK|nr:3-oxoacyl-[acyl-carrier-protein] synthase III C-terminal domain-containing protein [Undibacterium luofuense]MBR7781644.1 3-oxoacyl-ACP synthase [Undibacterium luofuense]
MGYTGSASGSVSQQGLPVRIVSTGTSLPPQLVTSAEFDQRWQLRAGTTAAASGVELRHQASSGESAQSLAVIATRAALDSAGLKAQDLDCVVSASSTPQQAIPCFAAQIHAALGLQGSGIPAFDLNATCLSFLVALEQLSYAIAAGRYRRVLLVSAELPSRALNPACRYTAPLFGDGAAAVILERSDADGSALLAAAQETYSEGQDACHLKAGGSNYFLAGQAQVASAVGTFFEMDGKALYKLSARHLPALFERVLRQAGVRRDQIQCFIPHQASGKALSILPRLLDISPARIVNILASHGNQVAASMPFALDAAIRSGKAKRGDLIALIGTGAGVSLGVAVMRL